MRITFDAARDETSITFCGGGATATIRGGEADPTASKVAFSANDPKKQRALDAIAHEADGIGAGPLVVPFIGSAIDAFRRGVTPGAPSPVPSVGDVAVAHAAIFCVYEGPPAD